MLAKAIAGVPIVTGTGRPAQATVAAPLALSGDPAAKPEETGTVTPERKAELLAIAGLRPSK